jgi:predicted site-specific integrase-resolvase
MSDTPPWQDTVTLCKNLCISDRTLDAWVAQGIVPPPRKRGNKNMWKWSEVDELLTSGRPSVEEEIRNATRKHLLKAG